MLGRYSFLLAATLLVPVATSAAPLQPTGKWEVQYTASNCTAKRAYGDYALVFEPSPLGLTRRYFVQGPGKAARPRQYNSLIEPSDGRPPIKTTSLLFPLKMKGARGLLTVLPIADAQRIEESGRFQISTRDTGIRQTDKVPHTPEVMTVDLSLGPMAALSKALNDCMDDLRTFWGMVDGKLPEPAIKTKTSLQGIFTSDDYPADAMAANDMGSTKYLLLIDEHGALLDCVVTETSGVASLDAMGCQVIRERAKFTVARDADGKPVKDTYSSRVHWEIVDR